MPLQRIESKDKEKYQIVLPPNTITKIRLSAASQGKTQSRYIHDLMAEQSDDVFPRAGNTVVRIAKDLSLQVYPNGKAIEENGLLKQEKRRPEILHGVVDNLT